MYASYTAIGTHSARHRVAPPQDLCAHRIASRLYVLYQMFEGVASPQATQRAEWHSPGYMIARIRAQEQDVAAATVCCLEEEVLHCCYREMHSALEYALG